MSQRSANCPNCGAPVSIRWSSAIQTVCPYCRSIWSARTWILPKWVKSPTCPWTARPFNWRRGDLPQQGFRSGGRIVYEYELVPERVHLVFNDNTSGWLSDAQLEYAVSMFERCGQALPAATAIARRAAVQFHGVFARRDHADASALSRRRRRLAVRVLGQDRRCLFADLRGSDARFGTIDYSETPPLLFLGEAVEFEDLCMLRLREFEGWNR